VNNKTALFFIFLTLSAFGVLAALAALVGGISIRAVGHEGQLSVIENVPEALVPGIPVVITVPSAQFVSDMQVTLRTSEAMVTVPAALVRVRGRGEVVFTLPCDASSGKATIVLSDATTGQVIAYSREVRVLPPGPDCAL
jgi:hypothetical protein